MIKNILAGISLLLLIACKNTSTSNEDIIENKKEETKTEKPANKHRPSTLKKGKYPDAQI